MCSHLHATSHNIQEHISCLIPTVKRQENIWYCSSSKPNLITINTANKTRSIVNSHNCFVISLHGFHSTFFIKLFPMFLGKIDIYIKHPQHSKIVPVSWLNLTSVPSLLGMCHLFYTSLELLKGDDKQMVRTTKEA